MISLLVPSRGRPDNLRRLWRTATDNATRAPFEIVARLDHDDPADYPRDLAGVSYLVGPRVVLAEMWNEAWRAASGDIFGLLGDDVTIDTPGWDRLVADAFPPDGIAYVHGDDLGGKGDQLGTHGFVTRAWTDTVGVFVPPYFSADYVDRWLNDVADAIGRRVFVPTLVTEHHHPAFGKADWDLTHLERVQRQWNDDVDTIWADTEAERVEWVEKLRTAIDAGAAA